MHQAQDGERAETILAEVNQALSAGRRLAFPPALERQYDAETAAARSRSLAVGVAIFAVINLAFIALDYFSVADEFVFAVHARIGVTLLVLLPVAWLVSRNPPTAIREWLIVFQAVVSAAMVLVLVVGSSDPLRQDYHYGILFILIINLLSLRLRFRYALPMAFTFVALHLATIVNIATITLNSKIAAIGLTQATTVFALMAVYTLEKNERLLWLRALGDRLKAQIFEELAAMDPMTGLGNRRAMQHWVELRHSATRPGQMALVMIDIDHFKAYNDSYGHLAGDDCIRRVAGVLRAETRKTGDRVFRFGGEEFVALLDGMDEGGAIAVAERMRRAVSALGIPHKASPAPAKHVTASFGVGTGLIAGITDLDALIAVADRALYQAKRDGRNCVSPAFLAKTEPPSARVVS